MHKRVTNRPFQFLGSNCRQQAETVFRGICGKWSARRFRTSGHQIDKTSQLVACGARADSARPASEKGNAVSPLVDVRLLAAVVEIGTVAKLANFFGRPTSAVVARHDQKRVVSQPIAIKR